MGINGIGADYPAWRETGKVQKNGSGIGFASRMADMVGTNASESGRKTNVVSGRDNYVGGNTTNIYGMGVYSRKDISVPQESNLPIETERYKIEDASYVEGVPAYEFVDKLTGKTLKHFSNEGILSDEEVEQVGSQESETKTEIIVKPDGSRVLIMTMSIGGMETTMSLEISKPTEAPNENSKQDTDNNMPTSENNTVSDEMSNISNEG